MHTIDMRQHFRAAPARVFAAITDHAGMPRWIEGLAVELVEQGVPAPNGVGAVRRIGMRGATVDEQVVRYEEPGAMDYRIVRGGPMRDHLGRIRLSPASDGGTDVHYTIEFRIPWFFGGPLLGALLARLLESQIGGGLARLAEQLG